MTVIDSWYIKQEVYEETFDSQSMDEETFEAKLKARLKSYNDNLDPNDENYGKVYKLGSDAPRFYTMADEKNWKVAIPCLSLPTVVEEPILAKVLSIGKRTANRKKEV